MSSVPLKDFLFESLQAFKLKCLCWCNVTHSVIDRKETAMQRDAFEGTQSTFV